MKKKRKILVAKTAGFCMGVKRAVDMAMNLIDRVPGPIYSYGPLIHNPQVTGLLTERGVIILPEGKMPKGGTVVIRAHGIAPDMHVKLAKTADSICDATCPFVVKVQDIIKRYSQKGYSIVIIGDTGHAEVESYLGYAGNKGKVISSVKDAEDLIPQEKICIVAQTTFDQEEFDRIIARLGEKYFNLKVFHTICSATTKRQKEAMLISRLADAMIVVGGKNSANSLRLAQICRRSGKPVYYIETPEELDLSIVANFGIIGVTAGASTSKSTIESVVKYINEEIV